MGLGILIRMAFRNLVGHARRTAIAGFSIAAGMAILLWYGCLLEGRNFNMINTITSTYTGHLQLYKNGYLKNRLPNLTFEADSIVPVLQKNNFLYSLRIHLPAIISSGDSSSPILLEGVDPQRESTITKIKQNLKVGEFLTQESAGECVKKEIYVGQSLAETLNVGIGEKLVILAQANDGTLGNELFFVKGLFNSGSPEFDRKIAYASLDCVRAVGALAGVNEVAIGLPQNFSEANAIALLQQNIKPDVEVSTWRKALPEVARMIHFNDVMMKMITTILFSVIVLGVINTMLISVFERTKEFGTALALGLTPNQLRVMIFLESLFLGLFSIIFGTLLGGLVVYYHQTKGFDLSIFFGETTGTDGIVFDLVIKPIFQWVLYFKLSFVCLCFTMAASLYPAYRASKLDPIQVMR